MPWIIHKVDRNNIFLHHLRRNLFNCMKEEDFIKLKQQDAPKRESGFGFVINVTPESMYKRSMNCKEKKNN
ncbi:hypothetical protein EUGRSUZ_I00382 [Eucalyptus grandis]|uniref:Uncharacterized protein n=2 Tax=Eucalyptus grandis TaxID=71139 RepID=A0ACC3JC19_EUCGR|nr:hypothetical protein EUGRSUZ_I00382 [Eucalyptus grandis]